MSSITARIVDADGAHLPDASLLLTWRGIPYIGQTAADSTGYFRYRSYADSGAVARLMATHAGYETVTHLESVHSGDSLVIEITLPRLGALDDPRRGVERSVSFSLLSTPNPLETVEEGWLTGVVAPGDAAIQAYRVLLRDHVGQQWSSTLDEEGRFAFRLPSGVYRYVLFAGHGSAFETSLTVTRGDSLAVSIAASYPPWTHSSWNYPLNRGMRTLEEFDVPGALGVVTGAVSADNGYPPNVTRTGESLVFFRSQDGVLQALARTGEDGSFVVGLQPGTYFVSSTGPPHSFSGVTDRWVLPDNVLEVVGGRQVVLEIKLKPPY
ncbi:MAG: carboxypeptidase regulatory-like domain-containing protein [Rhodothermales bacterium]|nr:carboxypeptidase regulatory-like domain-containing protein [Rhodothermales bacterium]MBO6778276.1 carboxypeptidase regulatory-like domain-containing protein [Rhodothermales bacterium]